ncbi:MAG: hypothetical protein AB7K36_25800, partial [Chloroflexota bacterium]
AQPGTSSAARLFRVRARQPDDLITLRRRAHVSVGHGLRLVVLDVPTDVQPGQTAQLIAYLLVETRAPSADDLQPYVELTDPATGQRTITQRGGLPSAEWQPGDLLVQQMNLTVPVSLPAGDYPLRLGLAPTTHDLESEAAPGGSPPQAAVLRVRAGH